MKDASLKRWKMRTCFLKFPDSIPLLHFFFTFCLHHLCFPFLAQFWFCSQPFLFHMGLFHRIESWSVVLHVGGGQPAPPCHGPLVIPPCWSLSHIRLFATPWTVTHQAPLSMGFSRQEYWSGLPFHSIGNLLDSGIKPRSPALQADSLLSELPEKPHGLLVLTYYLIDQTLLSFSFCSKMGLPSFIVNTCWIFEDSSFLWCFIYIPFFLSVILHTNTMPIFFFFLTMGSLSSSVCSWELMWIPFHLVCCIWCPCDFFSFLFLTSLSPSLPPFHPSIHPSWHIVLLRLPWFLPSC